VWAGGWIRERAANKGRCKRWLSVSLSQKLSGNRDEVCQRDNKPPLNGRREVWTEHEVYDMQSGVRHLQGTSAQQRQPCSEQGMHRHCQCVEVHDMAESRVYEVCSAHASARS